jgi:hypothetical protein
MPTDAVGPIGVLVLGLIGVSRRGLRCLKANPLFGPIGVSRRGPRCLKANFLFITHFLQHESVVIPEVKCRLKLLLIDSNLKQLMQWHYIFHTSKKCEP